MMQTHSNDMISNFIKPSTELTKRELFSAFFLHAHIISNLVSSRGPIGNEETKILIKASIRCADEMIEELKK